MVLELRQNWSGPLQTGGHTSLTGECSTGLESLSCLQGEGTSMRNDQESMDCTSHDLQGRNSELHHDLERGTCPGFESHTNIQDSDVNRTCSKDEQDKDVLLVQESFSSRLDSSDCQGFACQEAMCEDAQNIGFVESLSDKMALDIMAACHEQLLCPQIEGQDDQAEELSPDIQSCVSKSNMPSCIAHNVDEAQPSEGCVPQLDKRDHDVRMVCDGAPLKHMDSDLNTPQLSDNFSNEPAEKHIWGNDMSELGYMELSEDTAQVADLNDVNSIADAGRISNLVEDSLCSSCLVQGRTGTECHGDSCRPNTQSLCCQQSEPAKEHSAICVKDPKLKHASFCPNCSKTDDSSDQNVAIVTNAVSGCCTDVIESLISCECKREKEYCHTSSSGSVDRELEGCHLAEDDVSCKQLQSDLSGEVHGHSVDKHSFSKDDEGHNEKVQGHIKGVQDHNEGFQGDIVEGGCFGLQNYCDNSHTMEVRNPPQSECNTAEVSKKCVQAKSDLPLDAILKTAMDCVRSVMEAAMQILNPKCPSRVPLPPLPALVFREVNFTPTLVVKSIQEPREPYVIMQASSCETTSRSISCETDPSRDMSRETTPSRDMSRETTPSINMSRETTPSRAMSRETTPSRTTYSSYASRESSVGLSESTGAEIDLDLAEQSEEELDESQIEVTSPDLDDSVFFDDTTLQFCCTSEASASASTAESDAGLSQASECEEVTVSEVETSTCVESGMSISLSKESASEEDTAEQQLPKLVWEEADDDRNSEDTTSSDLSFSSDLMVLSMEDVLERKDVQLKHLEKDRQKYRLQDRLMKQRSPTPNGRAHIQIVTFREHDAEEKKTVQAMTSLHTLCNGQHSVKFITKPRKVHTPKNINLIAKKPSRLSWIDGDPSNGSSSLVTPASPLRGSPMQKPILKSPDKTYPYHDEAPELVVITRTRRRTTTVAKATVT